jgi:hypothetical protein
LQHVPKLVAFVQRLEKGHRVGAVDEHRHAELPSLGPQRVQAHVVHGNEVPLSVFVAQPQFLKDLEPTGPGLDFALQLLCHTLAESGCRVLKVRCGEIDQTCPQCCSEGTHAFVKGEAH